MRDETGWTSYFLKNLRVNNRTTCGILHWVIEKRVCFIFWKEIAVTLRKESLDTILGVYKSRWLNTGSIFRRKK